MLYLRRVVCPVRIVDLVNVGDEFMKLYTILLLNVIIWFANLIKTGGTIDIIMTIIGLIMLFFYSHYKDINE